MSLVADYSDSDENSESGVAQNEGQVDDDIDKEKLLFNKCRSEDLSRKEAQCVDDDVERSTTQLDDENKLANFLMPDASDSSDSESEEDNTKGKPTRQIKAKPLDNPFRTIGDVNVSKEDSVFRNPFRDKEDERIAVLEHHVKMTENPQTSLLINGKKICWNYRKRKCYLGTQCPYAHDSDVPLTAEQLQEQKQNNDLHRSTGGVTGMDVSSTRVKQELLHNPSKTHLPGTASVVAGGYDSSAFFTSPHLGHGSKKLKDSKPDSDNEEEKPYSKSKKKRAGLNNSLIPPKKALNLYHRTKDK